MRSGGAATSDGGSIYRKQLNGVPAGLAKIVTFFLFQGNDAIRETFQLPPSDSLKPTCSGKLLSCGYTLSVGMVHDISCDCCSNKIGGAISIVIFNQISDHFPVHSSIPSSNAVYSKLGATNDACSDNSSSEQFQQL